MPKKTTKAPRKAVRKAGIPKGIPTGKTISYGDEKVEHLFGPYVPLLQYFHHNRHWCGPEHNGAPRTVDRQFLELEREGIDCLYRTLTALVEEIYPSGSEMRRPTTEPNLGRWGDMRREHAEVKRAWALNNGAVVHRGGPMLPTDPKGYVSPYGATYNRARHQLVHSVMVPHVVTPEEAERDGTPLDAGRLAWSPDPTQGSTATVEQVGHRWAEVYAEMVRNLLGDEPNDETLAAFAHLHAKLKRHVFGSREGARVMQRMKPKDQYAEGEKVDSLGAEVLAAFARIREHLNALLGMLADERTPDLPTLAEGSQPQQRRTDRITWNDTAALLAYLLTELIEADYITPPPNGRRTGRQGNRAAVADLVYQMMDIRDRDTGKPVTPEYFRSLMRPSSPDRDSRADLFKIRSRTARNEPT
jgi:hypothetical protein